MFKQLELPGERKTAVASGKTTVSVSSSSTSLVSEHSHHVVAVATQKISHHP